jgi:hypothetical protein
MTQNHEKYGYPLKILQYIIKQVKYVRILSCVGSQVVISVQDPKYT